MDHNEIKHSTMEHKKSYCEWSRILQEKTNVLCVQETWLRAQWDFVIQGYTAIRNDRKNGKGGGGATFVQEGMRFSVIKLGKEYESIVIKIWTGKDEITVVL